MSPKIINNDKSYSKTHAQCRVSICLLCFSKTKELRQVRKDQEIVIKKYFFSNYDANDERFPSVLCGSCRHIVREYELEHFKSSINVFNYSQISTKSLVTRSKNHM